MGLVSDEWFGEYYIYTNLSNLIREAASAADIDDLLALTDGAESSFATRRALAEAIGIGESTISGWVKEGRMPPLAKALVGLVYISMRLREIATETEAETSNLGDMIVRDGDAYMIVSFGRAGMFGEHGSVGEIAAKNIPDQETALRLVSHRRLRHGLNLAIGELTESLTRHGHVNHDLLEYLKGLTRDEPLEEARAKGWALDEEIRTLADELLTSESTTEAGETNHA